MCRVSFARRAHVAHAEVSLKTAGEVVDENGAVFLNTQEIVTDRPAQLLHHTALPLHTDKRACLIMPVPDKRGAHSQVTPVHWSVRWVFTRKLARVPPEAE